MKFQFVARLFGDFIHRRADDFIKVFPIDLWKKKTEQGHQYRDCCEQHLWGNNLFAQNTSQSKGATSRFAHMKSLAYIFFQVRRLQSVLICCILNHPCFFIVQYYLFGIYDLLYELLFSDILQFKGNFVHGQNNPRYCDWAPLMNVFSKKFVSSVTIRIIVLRFVWSEKTVALAIQLRGNISRVWCKYFFSWIEKAFETIQKYFSLVSK